MHSLTLELTKYLEITGGEVLKNQRTRIQASQRVKEPFWCVGVHDRKVSFGLQRSAFCCDSFLGLKEAVEQWRCPAKHRAVKTQALDWGYAEDLTHRHQHLCSHSSCGASSSSCDHSHIAGCKNQCVMPLHTPELTCMAQMHTAVCVHRWVGRSPQKIKAVLTTSPSC